MQLFRSEFLFKNNKIFSNKFFKWPRHSKKHGKPTRKIIKIKPFTIISPKKIKLNPNKKNGKSKKSAVMVIQISKQNDKAIYPKESSPKKIRTEKKKEGGDPKKHGFLTIKNCATKKSCVNSRAEFWRGDANERMRQRVNG